MTSPVARPLSRPVARACRRPALVVLAAVLTVAACAPVAAAPERATATASTTASTTAPTQALPVLTPIPTEAAVVDLDAAAIPAAPSPPPAVPTQPFELAIGTSADWIQQYTFEWCVGASLQMTANLLRASADRSRGRQQSLWEMARDRSASPFGGANPRGWTAALNDLGLGPYVLASRATFEDAVRAAAYAIRATRKPVGLVMWSGRHAWVMSGFTSLGDPATDEGFQVTGARVLDPLYPHGDDKWGPSPRPGSLIGLDTLAAQFVARGPGRVDLGVAPGWLVILPIAS